jgi:HD-GYP domain-containing protein (c-di-GMP phosphodiesterase class II)
MKTHPQYAYDLLKPIAFLGPALHIPYCHHERWDGSGYPRGLKGTAIPLPARLFAVVDVWDALRSDRPYRPAWSVEATLEHIRSLSGTYFDPQVVEAFLDMIKE